MGELIDGFNQDLLPLLFCPQLQAFLQVRKCLVLESHTEVKCTEVFVGRGIFRIPPEYLKKNPFSFVKPTISQVGDSKVIPSLDFIWQRWQGLLIL